METWREELYLAHSALGTRWKNARYIAKEKVNGKWMYFYSVADYAAWQKKNGKTEEKTSRIPEKDYKEDKTKKTTTTTKKTETTKSTSKKSSGSSGSSKKSSSKKSKSGSSKKSSGGKVKAASEKKATATKAASEKKEKVATTAKEKVKVIDKTPIGVDFIKRAFNLKDADVKTRVEKDPVKLESLLNTNNDDGAYGYLVMNKSNGTTETVRWSKYNGQVTLKKFDSDEVVTFDKLPQYMTAQEIRINKKNK